MLAEVDGASTGAPVASLAVWARPWRALSVLDTDAAVSSRIVGSAGREDDGGKLGGVGGAWEDDVPIALSVLARWGDREGVRLERGVSPKFGPA